ncbi:DNA cytosine methyltransferase [Leclercia pneumoniae]|uniref:DNA cytosine methyltransferase n=1 Tax=Leclercia pneumoniae TaxID=2815358 RepID=UPI0021E5D2BB|nr:DNA cytosine methyltransferase [Leclercia pneumoniae]MCV2510177.1 DNA cytosine methyltransferase [Leclercia pneumoniae]WNN79732.1 DNA cytosine methyltransferase [Leclercia pneumoniae]
MSPSAYYNEIDPFAAQWLRNLIAGGHIAPGEVDERSIEDVTPDDLRGFTQCHFFAGIGVWSHSLRLAGWPDDKPVWTGSCPCQPFSAAGKGDGFADERHLWPHFFHLISERRPQHVFGEQVAAGNANAWFDLVQADLEGMGYAFGLVPFTSASIGAPHIRERAYWVAESAGEQCEKLLSGLAKGDGEKGGRTTAKPSGLCGAGSMDNSESFRWNSRGNGNHAGNERKQPSAASENLGMAYANNLQHTLPISQFSNEHVSPGRQQESAAPSRFCGDMWPLEVNGFWRDADWLLCRDGKWRPVEPGTFPLVDGAAVRLGRVEPWVARVASSNRVGRLKGYGNAINAQAAAEFIRAYMGVA